MSGATDRVVVVAAGFGVWQGGKHLASARWSDVARVRAFTRDPVITGRFSVELALLDGSEVVLHEGFPGYDSFLEAAEAALRGPRPRVSWRAAMQQLGEARKEILLFERNRRV